MGSIKLANKGGRIAFHVGKELSERGESIVLVPGKMNAQGRGVYTADYPQLKYSGGEHYREVLERTPVFCVPMQGGNWAQAWLPKNKGGFRVYNSAGKVIRMDNLQFLDGELEGRPVRYYFSDSVRSYVEPPGMGKEGDEMERFRDGKVSRDDFLVWLEGNAKETEYFDPELIADKIAEAGAEERLDSGAVEAIMELLAESRAESRIELRRERGGTRL